VTATQTAPQPAALSAPDTIEASCRAPLLGLFFSAACWLAIATFLSLLASVKLHAPHLLANNPWLTYGRVRPAALDSFLYGFAAQAGLGAGLWFLCRLGRAALIWPWVATAGMAFWNFAVTVGVLAVLGGDSTGYIALEMPRYVAPMLFAGYLLIAVSALLTFHARREGPLYPTQWFVLGAVFWFPWIFSTAAVLLLCGSARGVLQASISWWYANNFSEIFLGFAGLASIFYFIPKLTGRPLHSSYWAAFAFWILALFGSWAGLPEGSPLPVWISSMSTVGTVLISVAVLAVALNFYQTTRHNLDTLDAEPTLRFTYVALIFWLIASTHQIVSVVPAVNSLVGLTWFGYAQKLLQHYGFFAFSAFGAIYYIVPRLLDVEWCPRLLAAHFWLMLLGTLTAYLSLVIGGVAQGVLLSDSRNSFFDVLHTTMTAVRISTVGDLLLFVGALVFLANFLGVLRASGERVGRELLGRIS